MEKIFNNNQMESYSRQSPERIKTASSLSSEKMKNVTRIEYLQQSASYLDAVLSQH